MVLSYKLNDAKNPNVYGVVYGDFFVWAVALERLAAEGRAVIVTFHSAAGLLRLVSPKDRPVQSIFARFGPPRDFVPISVAMETSPRQIQAKGTVPFSSTTASPRCPRKLGQSPLPHYLRSPEPPIEHDGNRKQKNQVQAQVG